MDSLLCVYVVSCAASKPTFVSEVVFFFPYFHRHSKLTKAVEKLHYTYTFFGSLQMRQCMVEHSNGQLWIAGPHCESRTPCHELSYAAAGSWPSFHVFFSPGLSRLDVFWIQQNAQDTKLNARQSYRQFAQQHTHCAQYSAVLAQTQKGATQ